ncbi:hypothetical protein EIP86_010350 [Pleurotus ostreatoroseus]|nr:hypothetical protein EIP86_010350 [Pleurotus ostreatoroseus]
MYSPLIPSAQRTHLLAAENPHSAIRQTVTISLLSEFPLLLSGQIKLHVPVYTVCGACEDVSVLEKFRTGTYSVDNLHIIDEATTRVLDVGGVKLRLLGLGGALVPHKMFDNGDGQATIAGGQGTMWTTALQIGELVDTAQRVFDQTETRLLVTHASPGREGIIAQLALTLKADLTISAGLHFRYASSYNEFSVQGDYEGFRRKLLAGKEGFDKVWDSVKTQVDAVIDEHQRVLLDKALSVVERIPAPPNVPVANGHLPGEEPAWKNCWNWNLCDAAYGALVLDIRDGRVSAELKSQGFNYAYRKTATPSTNAPTPHSASSPLPPVNPNSTATPNRSTPGAGATPIAAEKPLPGAAKSKPTTPPPTQSGRETPKDKVNGGVEKSAEKAEKDRLKRERKKERKQLERAEREASAPGSKDNADGSGPTSPVPPENDRTVISPQPQLKSGKNTPDVGEGKKTGVAPEDGLLSPATESTGARTPTSKRPTRNPWTIFMRLPNAAQESEIREFFLEAKSNIIRVSFPNNYQGREKRMAYVEFGDEESMRAALDKHAEKLNDAVPEIKQATDRETRNAENQAAYRGAFGARGGRGRGGFAARGFAAAGLTRGPPRPNGEAAAPPPPSAPSAPAPAPAAEN